MPDRRSRRLFVNMAVHDLKRSMEFFSELGFTFNPQFTDDKAACRVGSALRQARRAERPREAGRMRPQPACPT